MKTVQERQLGKRPAANRTAQEDRESEKANLLRTVVENREKFKEALYHGETAGDAPDADTFTGLDLTPRQVSL